MNGSFPLGMILLAWSSVLLAQERLLIEEIIVTAQRIEENASKVPMSVSAFDDAMIEDRQIIGISDLQLNVPNFVYSGDNFGGARITLRGIGDGTIGVRPNSITSPGVPVHLNGVNVPLSLNTFEIYDMERVEVMRGPQGTLYGRSATGGAINLVTRRPDFTGMGGFVDVEYGDYDHQRVKGVLNGAVNDHLAFRGAGTFLKRDGYIENKAADDIPGIDDDMDDRDLHSYRITGEWRPVDDVKVWLMYSRFEEDDSRVRIHNQVCKRSDLPTLGCDPNDFGLEAVHPGASFATYLASLSGAIPLDISQLDYEFPRPRLSLREQHTDLNPEYEFEEESWLFGVEWALETMTVELSGGYLDSTLTSLQDYHMDVGYVMDPTLANPSGLWPTSAPSGGVGALRGGGPCDLESVHAGVFGGCTLNEDLNRSFGFDQSGVDTEFWSVELKMRSNLEGRFNYLLGGNWFQTDIDSEYYVGANAFDILGLFGLPPGNVTGVVGVPPLYPTMFINSPKNEEEGYSIFGELYVDLTKRLKLTVGARYTDDEKESLYAFNFTDAINVAPFLGGGPGTDPVWIRNPMIGYLFDGAAGPIGEFLADRYGATDAILAAATPEELIAALQIVPVTARHGEVQSGLGRPTAADWDEFTVRVVLDWTVAENVLVYGSFSQGYRPGGINLSAEDPLYESELVDAYELGAKTLWADGSLAVNVALFFNDYEDLQLFGFPSSAINTIDNYDAETLGMELELTWRPLTLPSIRIDVRYAWLDTEFRSGTALDLFDRTQGDADVVLLRNIDLTSGAPMTNYVAPVSEVLPLVSAATAAGAAIAVPGAFHENGIPVYFSRGFLEANGVATFNGYLADLDGNELLNSPPHSVGIGIAHTWTLEPGALTLRYDYYWQDSSYSREFNTRGDKIDSWQQHNASLIFESANGRWSARAWIRNITNEDIVTGQSVAHDQAGNYRNYFMAEPRIYGASLRYNFGVL